MELICASDLLQIMRQNPDLCFGGFWTYSSGYYCKTAKERKAKFAVERQRLYGSLDLIQVTCNWIAGTFEPSNSSRVSSAAMKVTGERYLGYISTGTVIASLLICGYQMKKIRGSDNALFNVSKKSLYRAIEVAPVSGLTPNDTFADWATSTANGMRPQYGQFTEN